MGADGYRKDEAQGKVELMAFWQSNPSYSPGVKCTYQLLDKLIEAAKTLRALPESELGYINLQVRREDANPKAPSHKALHQPPKRAIAVTTPSDDDAPF